ncbi:hypothetical protein KP509_10G042600 [Ceratopteris richardii]|uniref:Dirigent protein n=1 Tax=Ceratopteris richardii TaxID=49495 RepID=A0A8T2U473_CERRI|nr:hypothetical protein KP509_10G042600 [Ceratopteris richardii]
MERVFFVHNILVLVVVFSLPAALLLKPAEGSDEPPLFKKNHLKYYVQLESGKPGNARSAEPINTTFSNNFGQSAIFAFNVTKSKSRTSKVLGFVRGYTVETSYAANTLTLLEVEFLEYDDGHYSGTLQYQGVVTMEGSQLAIAGGTGSFRGLQGYVEVSVESKVEPFTTYRHDVTLLK